MYARPLVTWREFLALLMGLLSTPDSRLWRATRPPEPEPDAQMPDWTGLS